MADENLLKSLNNSRKQPKKNNNELAPRNTEAVKITHDKLNTIHAPDMQTHFRTVDKVECKQY